MKFNINGSNWEIKEISNAEMNMLASSDLRESFTHGLTQYSTNVIYLNEDTPEKRKTLIHELTHCFMYIFGHNQGERQFSLEDVCEICSCSHDMIHEIVEDYFKENE